MFKPLKLLHAALLCYLGMLIISACQDGLHYTEYKQMTHKQWDSRDTLVYQIPPLQHDDSLCLTLGIRSNKDFNYKAIMARAELRCDTAITTVIPITLQLNTDSLPFRHSNADRLSEQMTIHLKANKPYSLHITHSMRLNPLDGISFVGISLEK